VMRGGPGLGNIQPSQSDYNQIAKTAGHGDFRPIVLAPSTVQEAIDLMVLSFELADKYRTLVILALDGAIGQMMEPAELPPLSEPSGERPAWALTGADGRPKNIITSLYLSADVLGAVNDRLQAKLARIEASEIRYHEMLTEDAELVIVAFGTAARVAQTAVRRLRDLGVPIGLFRPISLWPFPEQALAHLATHVNSFLTVEMNAGQMVHDVRHAVGRDVQVDFIGWPGGTIPVSEDIEGRACQLWRQGQVVTQHLL
jgi:2-oxoglutarate ferredoxin oxidoreductase subunit alpha